MNAYEEAQVELVQDLINTYDTYLPDPEHLHTQADLAKFLADHDLDGLDGRAITLEEVRTLRTQLRQCWTVGTTAEMLAALNPLLAQAGVIAQIDPKSLALRLSPPEHLPTLQRLALACALGIAMALQEYGIERMRACAAEPCRDVFIDVSRNKTRRFCSDRCANRYNIAAFRERQKTTNDDQL